MTRLLRSIALLEGITHLEDLPLREFIRTVETLKDKIVTEKLDGANLWFGLDETGVYTSREGKSPKKGRFYSVDDYAKVAAYNGFRAAHLAIKAVEPSIRKHLKEGDTIEIEVLFGRQPNTVTYGVEDKNFIVVLRGVNDTPDERVRALSKALNNKVVRVTSDIISSPDGNELKSEKVELKWEFTNVAPMDTTKVDTKEAMARLTELKKFLAKKNENLTDLTNEQVVELSLTSVPKPQREEAKQERERINTYVMTEFKIPIKELLLNNFVRKIKPFLQAKDLDASEDIGVEGVVVRDPVSGAQTKIVDKDVFTAINIFNTAVRNNISGLVRTADQDAPIEARGGVFGQAKIRIADLLGSKELAVSSTAKKFISKFAESNAQVTAEKLANNLGLSNLSSIKTKVSAVLKNALTEVDAILNQFKSEAGEFKLQLKTGKEIGISPEVMKRTLTAFAETKKEINEVNSAVLKSKTPAQLVMSLYGRTINSLFTGGDTEVKESFSLLKSLQEEGDGGAPPPAAGGESGEGSPAAGGGEAQMVNPVGHPATTTSSSAIAPFPFKLFKGNKVIQRRKRAFTKPKKFAMPAEVAAMFKPSSTSFSLIKSINEDWAHVKDMKFATDVDDSAAAQNDVEFKQLRNNINMGDDITQMDVNRYLDKAHELNDEVDSVTFGLETDDGSIVKVYVNAQQADEFEAALAELLGQEDDVEIAINKMAEKFDIVDVEWPVGTKPGADEVPTDDGIPSDDSTNDVDSADEIDLETDTDVADAEETASTEVDLTTTSDEEETSTTDEPSDETSDEGDAAADDEAEGEIDLETDSDAEAADDSSEEDEATSDEEPSPDEDMPPLAKKKPKKKEESIMSTFGERFKQKLLSEAEKKKTSGEKSIEEFLDDFPNKNQRIAVALMLSLGAPLRVMSVHKAEILDTTDSAANEIKMNAALRTWIKKLMLAISTETKSAAAKAAAKKVYNLKESAQLEKQLKNYQWLIYEVLAKLGLPESVERGGKQELLKNIRELAMVVQQSTAIKINLQTVAELFGIEYQNRFKNEPLKNDSMRTESTKPEALTEDADAVLAALMKLFSALGIDTKTSMSIEKQLIRQDTRSVVNRISGVAPRALRFIDQAAELISDKIKPAGAPTTQLSSVQSSSAVISEEDHKAAKWVIASMGSNGVMMKANGMSIKLDADEAEKLSIALSKNKKVALKDSGGTGYVFTPSSKGVMIKDLGDSPKFPDGLHMSKDQAEELMKLLSD